MKSSNHVILIHNLSRRFGTVTAIDNLTLEVAEGELFGLIGPDGAGKTTILRVLAGVLAPTSGSATILGQDVTDSESIRDKIGYMSQRLGLYPDLTVLENISFYAEIYGIGIRERRDKVEDLLSFSDLGEFRHRRAGALSGGMRQKLALACTLVHSPKILLLDEPTNGVDPVSRREFWRILHKLLQQGVSIVVTTAYLDEADRCHRIGLMREGRLAACGTPEAVRDLFPGTILEILTGDPRRVAGLLRTLLPDCSVNLFGDKIRLFSADSTQTVQAMTRTMARLECGNFQVVSATTTLEDVFIWISSRGEVHGT